MSDFLYCASLSAFCCLLSLANYDYVNYSSRELEKRGIPSPTGKARWCRRAIDTLLSNEKYRGNSVATAPLMSDDSKSKQRSKYMLSKHHTAIIDNEQFEAVAAEKKRRCNIEYDENGVHRKHMRYTTAKTLQNPDSTC